MTSEILFLTTTDAAGGPSRCPACSRAMASPAARPEAGVQHPWRPVAMPSITGSMSSARSASRDSSSRVTNRAATRPNPTNKSEIRTRSSRRLPDGRRV